MTLLLYEFVNAGCSYGVEMTEHILHVVMVGVSPIVDPIE